MATKGWGLTNNSSTARSIIMILNHIWYMGSCLILQITSVIVHLLLRFKFLRMLTLNTFKGLRTLWSSGKTKRLMTCKSFINSSLFIWSQPPVCKVAVCSLSKHLSMLSSIMNIISCMSMYRKLLVILTSLSLQWIERLQYKQIHIKITRLSSLAHVLSVMARYRWDLFKWVRLDYNIKTAEMDHACKESIHR